MVHKSTAYSLKQSKSLRYRNETNITAKKKPETQATDQQRRKQKPGLSYAVRQAQVYEWYNQPF